MTLHIYIEKYHEFDKTHCMIFNFMLFICLFFNPLSNCYSMPLLSEEPLKEVSDKDGAYMIPNEGCPAIAIPIFNLNNRGVYLAVGTERGFNGAALASASRLILIDKDPGVVLFNRLNTSLLKLAKDQHHYLSLRSNPEALKTAIDELPSMNPNKQLWNEKNLDWWNQKVSRPTNETFAQLLSLHIASNHGVDIRNYLNPTGHFMHLMMQISNSQGGNIKDYLNQDSLFSHLQDLAKKDRIESHLFDLADQIEIERLKASLNTHGEKIGILDISNAWDEPYLTIRGVAQLINILKPAFVNNSILLLTAFSAGQSGWSYNGLSYALLQAKTEEEKPSGIIAKLINALVQAQDVELTYDGVVLKVMSDKLREQDSWYRSSSTNTDEAQRNFTIPITPIGKQLLLR